VVYQKVNYLGARLSVLSIERCAKLGLIVYIFLLVACVKQTRPENTQVLQQNNYVQQAKELFDQGKYQQAAVLYQHLANQPAPQQNIFRLQAAEVLLVLEEHKKAKPYLDLISPADLSIKQANHLHLLYVQMYLQSGSADQALKHLQQVSFSVLSRAQQSNYYESSAFAYTLTGQLLESAQQRIKLADYLESGLINENSKLILEKLSLVPIETLEYELSKQAISRYSGWLEMATILGRFSKGTPEFTQAMDAWALRNPGHLGQVLVRSGYFLPAEIVLGNIRDIAVLLPESGPYASYAKVIKEGIMAAYRQSEQDALQPDIQFYDTQGMSIATLYHQAVSRGAQLVIGPLDKKLVVELAENIELTTPVLALNYVEGLVKNNLYQFALSPYDEVQQAVKQARAEGRGNALILAPETAEGERLSHYFQNVWESNGGYVLAVQAYRPGARDFSQPVKQMLSIEESKFRFQQLSKTLGNIEYVPRRRQDVEVIFIIAGNADARLINPQFYHNRAQSVAVYGLARIYTGQPEPKKDVDLEGVSFCSIPWLFDQAYQGDLDKPALQELWQSLPVGHLSLMAFGLDAYTMLPYLNDLASVPYSGATGDLLLNEYNRIERHLVCAKFKNGTAQLLENRVEITEGLGLDKIGSDLKW